MSSVCGRGSPWVLLVCHKMVMTRDNPLIESWECRGKTPRKYRTIDIDHTNDFNSLVSEVPVK